MQNRRQTESGPGEEDDEGGEDDEEGGHQPVKFLCRPAPSPEDGRREGEETCLSRMA